MAKPLVFLLHGMGTHEAGWSKPATDLLAANAKDLNSEWTIKFHELEYDSKFREILGAWSKTSKQIVADAQPGNKEALKDLVGWLNDANDKTSFAWAAAADTFLWRTSNKIRNLLINHLAAQVAPVVAKATAGVARNVHFVGHSLGTPVLHEFLSALATGAWTPPDGISVNGFGPTRWRPMAVHMVSNVSKLLELNRNPAYLSPVKPGPAGEPTSYCCFYRSYGHKLDPIAQIGAFRPPWANSSRYEALEPTRVRKLKEVHDLEHYLAQPIVYVPMLETMFGKLPPDSGALDRVPQGFEAPNELTKNELREEAEKFGTDPSLFQTMRGIYEFFRTKK